MALEANMNNVLRTIRQANKAGSLLRTGLPLETIGQSCGDHFKEKDTVNRTWDTVAAVLQETVNKDLLIELGMPILKEDKVYNCLVYIRNKQIELIRPKTLFTLQDSKNEISYFTPFTDTSLIDYTLPGHIQELTGQTITQFGVDSTVVSGNRYFSVFDTELEQSNILTAIDKADLINLVNTRVFELGTNSSFQQKLATLSNDLGKPILNANFLHSYGPVLSYEGGAYLADKGVCFELIDRFSYESTVSTTISLQKQLSLTHPEQYPTTKPENEPEALSNAMAAYLWNQMVKTNASGFFIPLSGGADSGLTASIIYLMCHHILHSSVEVHKKFMQLTNTTSFDYKSPRELVNKILFTSYLPMSFSNETKKLSDQLAADINSNHFNTPISDIYSSYKSQVEKTLGLELNFERDGGSWREDIALQSLQARSRLTLSYLISQAIPVKYNLPSFLLIMATGNCSEVVRGYYSRYDNSSGDINILGSLLKKDIKMTLLYLSKQYNDLAVLTEVATQAPTAELKPPTQGQIGHTDETDMGFTYEELDFLTLQYKTKNKGLLALVKAFKQEFKGKYTDLAAEEKVGLYWSYLMRNRFKVSTLPPSVHLTSYDLDGTNDTRPDYYSNEKSK